MSTKELIGELRAWLDARVADPPFTSADLHDMELLGRTIDALEGARTTLDYDLDYIREVEAERDALAAAVARLTTNTKPFPPSHIDAVIT
ncbi:hypothetical protein [Cryobacterium sp. BB736]|uniref:hypothetical protein n=1 Tax=Cryobacterium sp. BB736 TaxID=2746963 RepID=UPI00187644A0|nr:hypothetical protein [Cryobacterium sp. BB736]